MSAYVRVRACVCCCCCVGSGTLVVFHPAMAQGGGSVDPKAFSMAVPLATPPCSWSFRAAPTRPGPRSAFNGRVSPIYVFCLLALPVTVYRSRVGVASHSAPPLGSSGRSPEGRSFQP